MTDDPEDYCAAETVVMDPAELARLLREMRFQAVPQTETTGVAAFFGTWPGDETDAELLEMLREIG